jgi:hypothetical protein
MAWLHSGRSFLSSDDRPTLFSTEFVRDDTRTIWIADGHHRDGKRFIVRADEKLTAFVEFEMAI